MKHLFTPAIILMLMVSGCHSPNPDVWRESDPTYIPFPVQDIVVSADNRFAGISTMEQSGKDTGSQGTYLLDLKSGRHRKLDSGEAIIVPAPQGHQ